jgi:acyl carrier protein
MNVLEELTDVFRSVFGNESLEITGSTTADDVEGWDSLAQITLVYAIEERFRISLSTEELEKMECVGDMVAAIESHVH